MAQRKNLSDAVGATPEPVDDAGAAVGPVDSNEHAAANGKPEDGDAGIDRPVGADEPDAADAAHEPDAVDAPGDAASGPLAADIPVPVLVVTSGTVAENPDVLDLPAAVDPAFTGAMSTIAPPAPSAPPSTAPPALPVMSTVVAPPEPEETAAWEPAPAGQSSPRRQRVEGPEPAAALTSDRLLSKVAAPPVAGWRRWLYEVTFGAVNVGDSDKVRLERAQDNIIAARLGGHTRYVPVLSRKGGVGKTTVTTLLGMVLADTREDRVIALDANPDRGTLSDRSPGSADFTARNLVKDRFSVTTFSQLSDYVARDGSRLDVLASDTDPAIAQAFDDSDYRAVTDILGKYYSIVLTDSGTGMVHSVMKGTLEKADAVVLVSGGSVDEARLASETLSWLEAHGRTDLVSTATVVINMSGGETQVDIDQIEDHFKSRVRNVLRIPYDKHLAEGSRVELAKLRPATRAAVKALAALVVSELQRS
jgi:MinD-like ATPase involved in chromosome partitioning or flagellar assembly